MTQIVVGGRRGGAWIGAAAMASALLSLVAQLAFERALGKDDFARWAYLNSLCVLWLPVACLGSNHLLLSEHYAGRAASLSAVRRLGRFYGCTSLLACTAFVALCVQGSLTDVPAMAALYALLFATQIPVILVYPLMQARGWAVWVAAWPMLQIGARVLIALVALVAGWHFMSVALAWTLASVGLGVCAMAWLFDAVAARRRRDDDGEPRQLLGMKPLALAAASFGINDLLEGLDLKLLVPLAAWFLSRQDTAAAGLVMVLLSAAFFVPHVLVSRLLLPAVHRLGGFAPELHRLVRRLCLVSVAAMLPMASAWWFVGPPLLQRVTSGGYREQSVAIAMCGFATVPLVLSMLGAAVHLARDRNVGLLRWRCEALGVFLGAVLVWQGFGLPGLVGAMAAGRCWLSLRVLGGVSNRPLENAQ